MFISAVDNMLAYFKTEQGSISFWLGVSSGMFDGKETFIGSCAKLRCAASFEDWLNYECFSELHFQRSLRFQICLWKRLTVVNVCGNNTLGDMSRNNCPGAICSEF